jgi:hypothetical protein
MNYNELNEKYKNESHFIIKQFISPSMVEYFRRYFRLLRENGILYKGDQQVGEKCDTVYGDPAFDSFLDVSTSEVSNIVGIHLLPSYTYARIYYNGCKLDRHVDRKECEHSCTLALGGDYDELWPIWIKEKDKEPIAVYLNPGDALFYKGTEVEHWREPFEGREQYQLFMHYVDKNGNYKDCIYDTRKNLGLKR